MSFYTPSHSLGTCNACGSPVNDGGQSGAYCSNNNCRNGWGGGDTAPSNHDYAKVRRAIDAGNPLWLIIDGIRDDENLTGSQQDRLISFATSLSER